MENVQNLKDTDESVKSNLEINKKYNNHLDFMDAYEQTAYLENSYNRPYQ